MATFVGPWAARSKAYAGLSPPAETVGSNPTGHQGHRCFSVGVLGIVRQRSLQRADNSSRGVLPTVLHRFEWSTNLKNVEAMAHFGPQCHKKKTELW